MHILKNLILALLVAGAPSFAAGEAQENLRKLIPQGAERFTGRIIYGSPAKVKLSIGWTRALSENDALSSELAADLNAVNMELRLDWIHAFGNFSVVPGLATSFGRGSPSAGDHIFLCREISPALFLEYARPELEARSFTDMWIPIQESQTTALWLVRSRLWGVVKWNDFGFGPRYEIEAVKDGSAPFALHEMWIGAFFIKYWQAAVFTLFLGYDTISMPLFQGFPKEAGLVFRGSFAHAF